MALNNKRLVTYRKIWLEPKSADIEFDELSKLLTAIGAIRREGNGSRVRYLIDQHSLRLHELHGKGKKTTLKRYQIDDVRAFLVDSGNGNHDGEAKDGK